jgi:uncharacterized protein YbjT (DUF2867 family)
MFAVLGITGQVGGAVARALLANGQKVRAVVRDAAKGARWAAQGCEVAVVADVTDPDSLTEAMRGTDGVFVMVPPNFDPPPGYPHIHATLASVHSAIVAARPGKVVLLSTIGAQVEEPTLLHSSKLLEAGLRDLAMPVAFLRAAWFMENAQWDVAAARAGAMPSFIQRADQLIPMVATADIGRTAAELLQESWNGLRIVELEGPRRFSFNDVASGFAKALGHAVRLDVVPREDWETLFRAQGLTNPGPRMRMLDGFNEGWIDFEGGAAERRTGRIELDAVLRALIV